MLLFGGILAFAAYIAYAALGNHLWPEYSPITTDISSLSAAGYRNVSATRRFGTVLLLLTTTFAALGATNPIGMALALTAWALPSVPRSTASI